MAPPKTDKDKEKEIQHLKKMLKMARKSPINFGIALGKGDESLSFFAHQARDPKSLRKKAREETSNSKGAHGEMTVDGKNLVFVCQDSLPRLLRHRLIERLPSRHLVLRQVIGPHRDLDVAALGDFERGPQGRRMIVKHLAHLVAGLHEEARPVELETLGVVQIRRGADAEQRVVGLVVRVLEIVGMWASLRSGSSSHGQV